MKIQNPTVRRDANGNRTVVMIEVDVPDPTPAEINRTAIENKARQALRVNATYLALANPTAAQSTAQVRSLTRQVNALIRLAVAELEDTEDT